MRRRHVEQEANDEVIDLRERLAPYEEAAFALPIQRPSATSEAPSEPELWKPLDFDFDYQVSEPT